MTKPNYARKMKKKPQKKPISFAQQLASRMIHLKGVQVNFEELSDGSCQYITVIKDGCELCLSFDGSGSIMTEIGLSKQIKEVVDYERIWSA